jgi:hypothetical protein
MLLKKDLGGAIQRALFELNNDCRPKVERLDEITDRRLALRETKDRAARRIC